MPLTGDVGGDLVVVVPEVPSGHRPRFTCQDEVDWLTPSRLGTWLRSVSYTGRKDPAALQAHLTRDSTGRERRGRRRLVKIIRVRRSDQERRIGDSGGPSTGSTR
ncbi:MAG: hypothetical protein ACT4O0_15590 [Pseudonocardia sp.]